MQLFMWQPEAVVVALDVTDSFLNRLGAAPDAADDADFRFRIICIRPSGLKDVINHSFTWWQEDGHPDEDKMHI